MLTQNLKRTVLACLLRKKKDRDPNKSIYKFLAVRETDPDFQEGVRALRKAYKMPQKGYVRIKRVCGPYGIRVPSLPKLPEQFTHDVLMFLYDFLPGLNNFWLESVAYYVVYNRWLDRSQVLKYFPPIDVKDIRLELTGPYIFPDEKEMMENGLRDHTRMYPVAILVSPYVHLEELITTIRNIYKKEVLPIQEKYRDDNVGIGKRRKQRKSAKDLNSFIYENRTKKEGELFRLIAAQFGKSIDFATIHKIRKKMIRVRGV